MSAPESRPRHKRKFLCKQGQVFALPVDDQWAFGLISRTSKTIPSLFLGHFFAYVWHDIPGIRQLPFVTASDAIYTKAVSHLAIAGGGWPVLAEISNWSPNDWPMPHFGVAPRPPYPVWREQVYDEMDPGLHLRTIRSSNPEEARRLPGSGSAGTKFAEKQLARILGELGISSAVPAPEGTYVPTKIADTNSPIYADQGVDLHYEFRRPDSSQIEAQQGRQIIDELEAALIRIVREPDEVSGVEFGPRDGVIFLRGSDNERLWSHVEPFARACPLRPAHVIFRRTNAVDTMTERVDL